MPTPTPTPIPAFAPVERLDDAVLELPLPLLVAVAETVEEPETVFVVDEVVRADEDVDAVVELSVEVAPPTTLYV